MPPKLLESSAHLTESLARANSTCATGLAPGLNSRLRHWPVFSIDLGTCRWRGFARILCRELLLKRTFWSTTASCAGWLMARWWKSPRDTTSEIRRKLEEYFAAGARPAWVAGPDTRTATV